MFNLIPPFSQFELIFSQEARIPKISKTIDNYSYMIVIHIFASVTLRSLPEDLQSLINVKMGWLFLQVIR